MDNTQLLEPAFKGSQWEHAFIKDKTFVLTNSLWQKFSCPVQCAIALLNRTPHEGSSAALTFGRYIHLFLADYFSRGSVSAAESIPTLFIRYSEAYEGDKKRTPDYFLSALTTIKSYLDFVNPYKVWQGKVETSFSLPLISDYAGRKIEYRGTIDLIADHNGQPTVVDHKTTSVYGESYMRDKMRDSQFMGYLWAMRQLFGRQPTYTYILNVIVLSREVVCHKNTVVRTDKQVDEWFNSMCASVADHPLVRAIMATTTQEELNRLFSTWIKSRPDYRFCATKFGVCEHYDLCEVPCEQRGTVFSQYHASDYSF